MVPKSRPFSLRNAIIQNLVVALIFFLLLICTGFDGNRVQEAWRDGAEILGFACTVLYLLMIGLISRRGFESRADKDFANFGLGLLMLPTFLIYSWLAGA